MGNGSAGASRRPPPGRVRNCREFSEENVVMQGEELWEGAVALPTAIHPSPRPIDRSWCMAAAAAAARD